MQGKTQKSLPVMPDNAPVVIFLIIAFALLALSPASFARDHSDCRKITVDDLASLYRETILSRSAWNPEEVEITDIKAYPPRIWVPVGDIDFQVRKLSSTRMLGRVAMEISVLSNGKPARTIRVCGRVEVYKNMPCAARDMRRGEIVKESDIALARMPLSRMSNRLPDSPENIAGMALKHSVRAGQLLTRKIVAPPVVIKRGERVTILAQSPAITIRVPGKAIQPGAAGDFIRVKNLQSRREIVAKVINSRTVKVLF